MCPRPGADARANAARCAQQLERRNDAEADEEIAAKETPQRKARVRRVRYDARSLAMCNILEFWQACCIAACRRNQTCRGDMHACFMRRFRSVPDDFLAFARECLDEQEQSRRRMRGL